MMLMLTVMTQKTVAPIGCQDTSRRAAEAVSMVNRMWKRLRSPRSVVLHWDVGKADVPQCYSQAGPVSVMVTRAFLGQCPQQE